MEAATYPTLLWLRLPPAGVKSDGRNASWKLPRVQELSSSLRRLTTRDGSHVSGGACVGCPLGKMLGTVAEAVDVPWGGAGAVLAAVPVVAVLAAVSVVAVLVAMLPAVHGSAPAEGHSRMFPAASDGCPLRKMLGTVTEAVDVPGAVQLTVQVLVVVVVAGQLAVFAAVQVGVVVDRKCDIGPSVGATMPSPDLLFSFWAFPSFDGGAVVLPPSPLLSPWWLVLSASPSGMWAPFSPWPVAECPCPPYVAH
ncbi:hypothetical protein NDU88_006389 [Pleurodeles waltl]|uniref:Uncharacterized protein n=1 Tax=Pleurodeles waltl TaxID=8319 RepID=A0AAV7WAK8_PLEWA|nr:hypothetical protein NDU88_006389 [Pleurodeles waltl]